MKNQSGVMRLINCEEHDMRLIDCQHIHEKRAIKEPLEANHIISFNDGNSLYVVDLQLRMERGKVYFLNANNRWQNFNVRMAEKRRMIE